MSGLPTWAEIRRLIVSRPKPPIRAIVTDSSRTPPQRLEILHDGLECWLIEEDGRVEMSAGSTSAVFFDGRELVGFRDMHVASSTHAKAMFQGSRIAYIDEASGTVVGGEICAGRDSWVVDVTGLRRDGEDQFRLHVDAEHGFLLRLEVRDVVVELTDVVIGTLQAIAGVTP